MKLDWVRNIKSTMVFLPAPLAGIEENDIKIEPVGKSWDEISQELYRSSPVECRKMGQGVRANWTAVSLAIAM